MSLLPVVSPPCLERGRHCSICCSCPNSSLGESLEELGHGQGGWNIRGKHSLELTGTHMQELRLKKEAPTPWLMQFVFLDPEAGSKWRQRGSRSRHQAAVFPIYHRSCVDRLTKARRVLGSLVWEVFLEAMLKLWHNKIKVTALRWGCGADALSGGRSPLSRSFWDALAAGVLDL